MTAYGDLDATRARITRIAAALRPAGNVCRQLADGSRHRLAKIFVRPGQLSARLRQLGWRSHIRRDGLTGASARHAPVNRRCTAVRPDKIDCQEDDHLALASLHRNCRPNLSTSPPGRSGLPCGPSSKGSALAIPCWTGQTAQRCGCRDHDGW